MRSTCLAGDGFETHNYEESPEEEIDGTNCAIDDLKATFTGAAHFNLIRLLHLLAD